MQFNPCMVCASLCMQIGQQVGSTTTKSHCQLIISIQCINHAAKPVQCSTLYFGAGRHSQGAGGRGQETAPGRLVPAGLYPWQGGERRPAMGDKRHGPGSSLTMPLAGRTKCGLSKLPGPFHKNKQRYLILAIYLKSQAKTHLIWNGIHTDYCHK